ncbi:MAG: hypothetical protein WDM79_16345 [Terricaulis sp.]
MRAPIGRCLAIFVALSSFCYAALMFEAASSTAVSLERAQAAHQPMSASAAEANLRRAPLQAQAWLRLAVLAQDGSPNTLCSAAECLERSWQAAPMMVPSDACARLQEARRQRALGADDPRIALYLASRPPRRDAAICLAFLPPDALSQALIPLSD